MSGRDLLFYTKGDQVMTVYEDSRNGRTKIWGDTESYEAPTPVARAAAANLPAYTVLFSVVKYGGGGRFGEVLIPSLSRSVPAAERERIARAIAKKEGFADITLYSTREAYEANMSEKYSKAHPGAMRKGFLGSLENGTFTPAEKYYP